jgi:hypothetical protein
MSKSAHPGLPRRKLPASPAAALSDQYTPLIMAHQPAPLTHPRNAIDCATPTNAPNTSPCQIPSTALPASPSPSGNAPAMFNAQNTIQLTMVSGTHAPMPSRYRRKTSHWPIPRVVPKTAPSHAPNTTSGVSSSNTHTPVNMSAMPATTRVMFTNSQRSQNARPIAVCSMFKAATLVLRFPSLSQREVQRSTFTCNTSTYSQNRFLCNTCGRAWRTSENFPSTHLGE